MEKSPKTALDELAETMARFSKAINENFEKLYFHSEEFHKSLEGVRLTFTQFPISLKILANHGWYITWQFEAVFINSVAAKLKKDNVHSANQEMLDLIDEMFERFHHDILESFPHRKSVLNAALNAHRIGEYYLSVPVFFAQAEGICKEVTGARFFGEKKQAKEIRDNWVNSFQSDTILAALMTPLVESGPMRDFQVPENPIGINRHDVLHGDSFDYGEDKVNSYKALSLLVYIATIVSNAKQRTKHVE